MPEGSAEKRPKTQMFEPLIAVATDLTAAARLGHIEPIYGRDRLVDQILESMADGSSPAILLQGPPEVGRSAIVHEIARRMAEGECPRELRGRRVFETSSDRLIAGCIYVGAWQGRIQEIVRAMRRTNCILAIRGIGGLTSAGRSSSSNESIAVALRSHLADGRLRMIGMATAEERRAAEGDVPAFISAFQTVEVPPTSREETLEILHAAAPRMEARDQVRIEPAAHEMIYDLCERLVPYRSFPGKAVGLLRSAVSELRRANRATTGPPLRLTSQGAMSGFARTTGLPEFMLSDHLSLNPEHVRQHFDSRVIGQPDASGVVADLIAVIKAGLNDPQKPLGCLFFVGPTGVGKTKLAKELASYLFGSPDRMVRIDMSEYADMDAVPRLIGRSGAHNGGALAAAVRSQPFSVVLLDEIEKADRSVMNLLLQVLGEARLTDGSGQTVDFRSTIIIMTSNIGAEIAVKQRSGLRTSGGEGEIGERFRRAVANSFSPEFVNRLDKIVVFHPLDRAAAQQIAAIEAGHALNRHGIRRRCLAIDLDTQVYDLLADLGVSAEYGARPLKRTIERMLITPISRELVGGALPPGATLRLGRQGDAIRIEVHAPVEGRRTPSGGQKQAVTLADTIDRLATLRVQIDAWQVGRVAEHRRSVSQILERSRSAGAPAPSLPALWVTVHLRDSAVRRADQLCERAHFLEELAGLWRTSNSRRDLAELIQSADKLETDLAVLDVELESLPDAIWPGVMLRIADCGPTQTGPNSDWPLDLARMYTGWASHRGIGWDAWVRRAGDGGGAWRAVRRLAGGEPSLRPIEQSPPREIALTIRHPMAVRLLASEAGVHERRLGATAPNLAYVAPIPILHNEPASETLAAEAVRLTHGRRQVVRTYRTAGAWAVRDLRTDLQLTSLSQTLAGGIDALLLAGMRHEERSNPAPPDD